MLHPAPLSVDARNVDILPQQQPPAGRSVSGTTAWLIACFVAAGVMIFCGGAIYAFKTQKAAAVERLAAFEAEQQARDRAVAEGLDPSDPLNLDPARCAQLRGEVGLKTAWGIQATSATEQAALADDIAALLDEYERRGDCYAGWPS